MALIRIVYGREQVFTGDQWIDREWACEECTVERLNANKNARNGDESFINGQRIGRFCGECHEKLED